MGILLGILSFFVFVFFVILYVKYAGKRREMMLQNFSQEEIEKINILSREIEYNDRQTKNYLMQCFESIHILRTTKNMKTFKSRFELFEKRYFQLVQVSIRRMLYNKAYNVVKENYQKKYYDRNLTKEMLALGQPSEFNHKAFLESVFSKFVNRLIQQTDDKISSLKTEKAKENAKLKLVNELAELKTIINDVGLSENKNLQKITDYE